MAESLPSALMWRQILPPQMVNDFVLLSEITPETLEGLSKSIAAYDVFGSEEEFKSLVIQYIPDEDQASAVLNSLRSLRPENIEQIIEVVGQWRNAERDHASRLSDGAFALLKNNLSILVRDYPAVAKIRKANWLGKATGNELQSIQFICDIRPVFNDARDTIELFIPIVTLKLGFERQNGEDDVLELVLDDSAITVLSQKLDVARQKLDALDHFMQKVHG
jgi:hypothetical protein